MKSLEEYCKENNKDNLLAEWDYDKNEPLTPQTIGFGSNKKVSWKCEKGHQWEATVGNRSRWSNCPYCAGKIASAENCLETLFPEIAKEWDYDKNEPLTPKDITAGNTRKVWWICPKGHSYQSTVHSRTSVKTQCPYCQNKKVLQGYNDLETTNPELLIEWDYKKNTIKPNEITAGSDKKAWWLCQAGHSFESSIGARRRGAGCPFCAGQRVTAQNCLANCDLRVAALWDYKKNYPLTPDDVAVKSSKRFYWICPKGHSWNAPVSDLTSANTGCPYCSGKRVTENNCLEKLFPEIAKQWDFNKNILKPFQVSAYSRKKAWWICPKGHSWEAVIGNRTSNSAGCPLCNNKSTSFPEQAILFYCRKVFTNTISRDKDAIGRELDVYIPDVRVAIEYDGTRWHQGEKIAEKEREKDALCKEKAIRLYRVIESGIKNTHEESVKCIYLKKSNMQSLEKAIKSLLSEITNITVDVDLKRDQTKIREAFMNEAIDESLAKVYPIIAEEWDFEKNGLLTPEMFSPGSSQKVWWKCKSGHSWQAEIGSRTSSRGSRCPYCTHKRPTKEYNLKRIHPEIAKEWDFEKNGELLPEAVLPQSTRVVYWKCSNGHSYSMQINHRTKNGCNCPYCSGKRINDENSLYALFPEVSKEWDLNKNGSLSPKDVGKGYTKKVWWICPKGHSYQMTVNARVAQGQGCIYCAGKRFDESNCLATIKPQLLKEWDFSKNVEFTPHNVGPGSSKKAWWICPKGHSYQAKIANKTKGSKCPYCSGKIAKKVLNLDTKEVYENTLAAAAKLGCSKSGIIYACDTGKPVRGFHLEYIQY